MSEYSQAIGRVISVDGAKVMGILMNGHNGIGHVGNGSDPRETCPIRIGDIVGMPTIRSRVFAVVCGLSEVEPANDLSDSTIRLFEMDLIGELPEASGDGDPPPFQRGVALYPVLDAEIELATQEERARIYAKPSASNIRVGVIHPNNDVPAYLITDDLLGKHFAILGSTGSGKSCSAALVLQAILADHPNGHVVVLDPHNEYSQVFGDSADVLSPDDIRLPYWMLNFDEIVEVMVGRGRADAEIQASILRTEIVNAKRKFAGEKKSEHITVDTPVPYSLSELVSNINGHMGRFENPESSTPYLRLLSRLDVLRSDKRYDFMFSGLVVRDILTDIMSRILSIPVQQRPFTILDLSGVPSEIVDVVVSVLCRIIFDFALWSVPAKALPVLLVCEEAHRYVPRDPELGFAPTKKALSRIAMEGRKYGVSLCLISQRPSELSPNILSQCNTLFALRMSNERDQEIARRAVPENAMGLLSALPSLRTQEAVVVGEGVPLPMRVRFDTLDLAHQPRGGNAEFSKRWKREDCSRTFVDQTIERWRVQIR